jgi:hypothetical protein
METYTQVCAHRGAYLREMTLWDVNPPGTPYTSPAGGTGRLAPGPQGQDREAAFADWHRANYGTDHADPCDGSPAPPAASPPGRWQRHGTVKITSGHMLLADSACVPDLLPQLATGNLHETAQIVPADYEGTVWVAHREDGVVRSVRVDFGG